jgi:hypothetical protein
MSAYRDVLNDEDELLRGLNERYIVVASWTTPRAFYSHCVVFDLEFRRKISFAEFRKRYCNLRIETGKTIAKWWLEHPERRQVTTHEELPDAE